MKPVCKEIFRAIHEGKWLKIEYQNKSGEITHYWISIKSIDVGKRMMLVDGLHLTLYTIEELHIYIDSIKSAVILDGTYCPVNKALVDDIAEYPDKYKSLFDSVANLKILNYLELCNKMDTIPFFTEYELIKYLDRDSFDGKEYKLRKDQFAEIVKNFSVTADRKKRSAQTGNIRIKNLAINVLSINTKKGLYPLAYRKLDFNVKAASMVPNESVTICTEFMIDGTQKESIRKYLDAGDYELLDDFEKNQELIKNAITEYSAGKAIVDDMPYIIGIGRDIIIDLHTEYKGIIEMYENDKVTFPIKAFFGDLLEKPRRIKNYPIALLDNRINLDQLLSINKAMRYPTAYIQGPPGTGKTNTIINTIVTAFFNERTVLFASYNNHPINGVFDKLTNLKYSDSLIPFPVLRLGNLDKVKEAVQYIRELYSRVETIDVFDKILDKRKDDRKERAKRLTDLLKLYEDYIELNERKDTINSLIEYQVGKTTSAALFPFELDLQGRQIKEIDEELSKIPRVTEEDALKLMDRNEEEFLEYLYYVSAKYVKRLGEDKYTDLRNIINNSNIDDAAVALNRYISDSDNVRKLQRVFPVIITTCISAHRIGKAEPLFDMTIIDEASQCNTAMTLVPIIRGENLMLVGDPQQLNPVILLDDFTNKRLMKEYSVPEEYNYRTNSIYKVYLASDSVSDEILLHNHYRCDPRIIGFNNKKYYNSLLKLKSEAKDEEPLVYVAVDNKEQAVRNTSAAETNSIVEYVKVNKDKNIGIITPFVNQKDMINNALKEQGIEDVTCGTVHTFQGDEKDVILFSTAIGASTQAGTYEWLKSNRELINVATSRAKDKLIVLADPNNVERLHAQSEQDDDLYELVQYVKSEGKTVVTPKETNSRALGVKPFSTETETAFLQNLTHALENIWLTQSKYAIHKEVAISQVFRDNIGYEGLFYTGRFDFVVYEKQNDREIPLLAIELDGKEHLEDEVVRRRDAQKNNICREHDLQLIRVDNTYARRYNYIKSILMSYFKVRH
ncbi:Protein of unknown function [Butyrivibrio hungatei DSM 14810]|uniref:Superfamily I DNA and/or RNA helicase n=1 Tax=Butyrivibrio hungatei DSM 14810 TaxID=1121132 RepID=A0A1M7T1M4_9FIRM|nr:AAA domain-containing protein [Butyrivibrio hungatei]SHN64564.1 Protein of unknown function [Butyrivibrio hungatei DSM 14810]